MLTALPALFLLIGLPHFGLKPRVPASPADSLPPPWKSVSRLALEDQFVRGRLRPLRLRGAGLELRLDPRALRVTMNPDSGTVSTCERLGEVELGPGTSRTLQDYSRETSRLTYERLWRDRSLQNLNAKATTTGRSAPTGLSFQLPSPLPPRVQSLLGPGGPALSVTGSENIRLSGQSNWSNQQTGLLGTRRSLFPTLNMQQDLDIRLEGQLSDRIKVNLLQNSANQIPLANKIAINYRGEEDDLVQALDLGNTSLTLPGTQYVSYSGRNEGLFGVKSALRYGPLDFTILASKQEGKSERASYTGGASVQKPQPIADFDYLRGVYFFLYDPSEGPNGTVLDIDPTSIALYRDNSDYSNTVNLVRGRALVDPLQTAAGPDTLPAVCGYFNQLEAGADKDYEVLPDVYGPYFKVIRLKRPMTGEQRLGVTYRARNARTNDTLLVGTQGNQPEPDTLGEPGKPQPPAIRMKLLRPPQSQLLADASLLLYETDLQRAPFNATRELELKNFYQLPGQGIDPQSFKISLQQGRSDPPRYTEQVGTIPVPYLELLGLDSYDETSAGYPIPGGHDGKLDGAGVKLPDGTVVRSFVDFKNGLLFLPDPRPFAPRLGSNGKWFDQLVSTSLSRRDSLRVEAADPHSSESEAAPNAANTAIYDYYNPRRDTHSTYFIEVEFSSSQVQGEIVLGRGNILEGSEVVTVSGQQWVRDKDYTIDYDLGRLVLKRQPGPSDQLNVNYSYSPLFQQAGRTLVGSAFRLEGREKSLGGAFMYESKGAQDLRPRIGEEPARSLITDLNTDWTLHPNWLTRLVDRLPGIRTTAPSDLHVQAEVGMSFPNPNTKKDDITGAQGVIYIDDMEGVRDAVSLSLSQEHWHSSSVPWLDPAKREQDRLTYSSVADTLHNGEVRWYSPPSAVKQKDLKPNLTDVLGARNPQQVLCISVPKRPSPSVVPDDSTRLWVGLTYPLDQVGLDLTRSQFIELWVNDFRDHHAPDAAARVRGRHVKLHVDLGTVGEDQMRAPDAPPNGLLDTEDKRGDNVLTQDEDTGLDGLMNPDSGTTRIRDLVTAGPADPAGDDFHPPDEAVTKSEGRSLYPVHWRSVNGTENNRTILPVPDTEDINLNRILDPNDDYVEYTIDLGDVSAQAPYLETDVYRDFPGVAEDNGWRRYRIPIGDPQAKKFGNPNLALVQHVRVWLQGIVESDGSAGDSPEAETHRPLLMLGGLDIVGSRWQQADLDAVSKPEPMTTMTLNSVNTVDNAEIYAAPFDPGQTVSGNQELTRREQSLNLEFTDLKPGSELEVYKNFSLDENYSRYGTLNWYVVAYDVRDSSGAPYRGGVENQLFYFVRFASDEQGRNYYEYRAPLPVSVPRPQKVKGWDGNPSDWTRVELKLTDLSNLKLDPRFPQRDPVYFDTLMASGVHYVVAGRPSFTRLRRISFGMIRPPATVEKHQGQPVVHRRQLWSGQLWFDELRATNVAKDVDHAQRVQVSGRVADLAAYNLAWNGRGADFLTVGESLGSGNSTDQLTWSTTLEPYRFFEKTGIVIPVSLSSSRNSSRPRFSAGDDVVRSGELQAASETRSESHSFSTSYSRAWSERSNPFLRYTIGGISASYARSQSNGQSPSSEDRQVTRSATVKYQIAPRKLLSVPIPLSKARLFPLPERCYWDYSRSDTRSTSYERVGALRDSLRLRNDLTGRSGSISFGADTRPLDFLRHHIEGYRNLTLSPDQVRNDRLGFINLGRVTSWRQAMDARYTFKGGNWLRPTFSWNGAYNQDNSPALSRDLSVRAISNGQSWGLTWDLPFDRLDDSPPAPRPAPGDTSRGAAVRRARSRLSWRGLLAALGGISTEAGYDRSSAYTRLTGTPSFAYLFGFTDRLDSARTVPQFGNTANLSTNWRANARTRVELVFGSTANTRFEFRSRQMVLNGVSNRENSLRFPDVEFDYGQVASVLRLDRVFTSPQLRSAYGRSVITIFANNRSDPTSRSATSEWRPLLGMSGSLKNRTRAELRIERRNTESEDLLIGHSIKVTRLTTATFSLNRSYSQGQKVNLLGKQKTVSSTITMGLTGQYEMQSGETVSYADATRAHPLQTKYPTKDDRLTLNATGSYAFSSNATGNVALGFMQDNNRQTGIVRRNLRVELRAQFTF
jgi:hypothetical protein